MPVGHTFAHRPQSMHASPCRRTRVSPNRESGCITAAIGQSQRQNGITMNSDRSTMAPETTYAQ